MRIPVSDPIAHALLRQILAVQEAQLCTLQSLERTLSRLITPRAPQGVQVKLVGENPMAGTLQYQITPAPLAEGTDVITRRLTALVNGETREPIDIGPGGEFPLFEVPQDAEVELSLVDIDDAGNASPATTVNFTAKDTIAPEAPAGVTVSLVGEV